MIPIHILMLVLILPAIAFSKDEIEFTSFHIKLSALTLNRDILYVLKPDLERIKQYNFPLLSDYGQNQTKLVLDQIKIQSTGLNETNFDMTRINYSQPIYVLQGNAVAIQFEFMFIYNLTKEGNSTAYGNGHGYISSVSNQIHVIWNLPDADVEFPNSWDITDLQLTGENAPLNWISLLLKKDLVPLFTKVLSNSTSNFSYNLLNNYRNVGNSLPGDIDLLYLSNLSHVKSINNNITFSMVFSTTITVNRHLSNKLYRNYNGSTVIKGDYDVCFSSSLVPVVLDALGKGSYFDQDVPYELFGFKSYKVSELFEILPSLRKRYSGNEEFRIHSQFSRFDTVNDITQKESIYKLLQMQVPMRVFIYVVDFSDYVLIMDLVLRFYYELKVKEELFLGHVRSAHLYQLSTLPQLPIKMHNMMEERVGYLLNYYHDTELMSPGIKIPPLRKTELRYEFGYIFDEELCIYYDDIRKP